MDELMAYQILGLEPGCSREEIKAAYAELSKEYHPEEYPDEFQRIHEAYSCLTRGARRGARIQERTYQEESAFQQPRPQESAPKYNFEQSFSQNAELEQEIEKATPKYNFGQTFSQNAGPEQEEEAPKYNFEESLRQGEQEEAQRLHEIVLQAIAEIKILLSPQYCNNMKLFRTFFTKPEYKEALHTAEFVGTFAELLSGTKLKKSIYQYFVSFYRLRGLDPNTLIPEARRLYLVLNQKVGGITTGNKKALIYGGIPAGITAGLRAARIQLKHMAPLGVVLFFMVFGFLCYWIYKKLYENHSSIFSQAIVALLIFVVQVTAVLTSAYTWFSISVEAGDIIAVLTAFAALIWLVVLGMAAVIKVVRRK